MAKASQGSEDEERRKDKEKPGKISRCWEGDPLFQRLKIGDNFEVFKGERNQELCVCYNYRFFVCVFFKEIHLTLL